MIDLGSEVNLLVSVLTRLSQNVHHVALARESFSTAGADGALLQKLHSGDPNARPADRASF